MNLLYHHTNIKIYSYDQWKRNIGNTKKYTNNKIKIEREMLNSKKKKFRMKNLINYNSW